MLRVYLDQNKWIDLARALNGDELGAPFRDAATVICAAVDAGRASLPLSSGHMFETWKRRDAESRQSLASVMATVSKNHAIAPPWVLLPGELDRALQRRFGRPLTALPLQPFGWGLAHRSGHRAPQLSQEIRDAILSANPRATDQDVTEWIDGVLLEGPPEDLPVGDIPQPPVEFAEQFADGESAQAQIFVEHGADKDLRRRAVTERSLRDIADPLHDAQVRALVTNDELIALGEDGMTEFILDLPSRAGGLELMWRQHDNAETRWHPNDLNDIAYLSTALAYCDVLVTERRWAHMFNQSDLPARFETTVLANLADLTELLVAASVDA
jgi:hypothetical protein